MKPDAIERLAAYLLSLHPAWRGRGWPDVGHETRELFREEAREAVRIYEGRD